MALPSLLTCLGFVLQLLCLAQLPLSTFIILENVKLVFIPFFSLWIFRKRLFR